MRSKLLIVFFLAALAGFVTYRGLNKPKPVQEVATSEEATQPEAESAPIERPPVVVKKVVPATNTIAKVTAANMPEAAVAPSPTPAWKVKMNSILGSSASTEQKIQDLRELLAKLEEKEAEEAVKALTLAVKSESFGFIKPLVVDPNLPEAVRDEFMVDLLNRPNSIKVPLMLELARNTDHPDHESAYEWLEIFTNQKLGADWVAWDKAVENWLKENPDRPRAQKVPVPANE